ncbi:MAG TPA: MATE family efflux transporter [Thermococcaceae archaeon]|uniref:MATE efflux family protein n=1 Tax=Thermococcus sibiricus TaxID=172049 RepID=A0A117L1G7_9EURY|nr:MATE family efflux transporter [Thermococcus sibiricus]KUK17813.1 MAG: MATE efflux family protein [Thermococcus sibiricus]KUK28669.1 MAG: MATE efflux family protein [Thermococcus sp. 40_45]HII67672.1 MATE family efflux transporter [Thermococcaceae archaeon]
MSQKVTKGVQMLLGEPKRAVIKLSLPMMVGMLVQSLYNLVDGIWVAGLGSNALAAIGLFFPIFMGLIALASGLGVGASSAISRRIGAQNKKGADNVADHAVITGLFLGVLLSVLLFPVIETIFVEMGTTQEIVELAVKYSRILILGASVIVFNNVANGILRGEGDTKRSMYAMVLGSGLNIILDPIFIYTLGLGVVGAAYATLLSMIITSGFLIFWLFFKRDTYVDITLKDFDPHREIFIDILRVGLPSALAQLAMSFAMFFINTIIIRIGSSDAVAIFTSAWRIIMLGTVPLLGMATATTAIVGASYGAKDIEKLEIAYLYAIKLGFLVELLVTMFIFIFASPITYLFTYSEGAEQLANGLVRALRILALFLPFVPFGMLTGAMFRGIGQGEKSLIVTTLRTIIIQVGFAYIFAFYSDIGLSGVWIGVALGNMIAVLVSFTWGKMTIIRLKEKFSIF